ncbi:hypothetical protein Y032_0211g2196 [Ancylostoma ceylanicum]|uniref:Serine-threonine/tyrosine-protein kinase catalytic domain-containing protein n=1 Tax=Ancylostoma ceylanicum TaxID=53326 RepID=A0A016SK31_9BILA|nr:hypothetical protein Y032_0211g2196 [Ancylostoma ceylanicum]
MGVQYQIRTAMKLPIKWLAPETISTFTFSLKTDVFSFGIVVFEIFSDGSEPWEGKTNAEVKVAVWNCFTIDFVIFIRWDISFSDRQTSHPTLLGLNLLSNLLPRKASRTKDKRTLDPPLLRNRPRQS